MVDHGSPGPRSVRLRMSPRDRAERRLDALAGVQVTDEAAAVLDTLLAYQGRRRSRARLRRVAQQITELPRLIKCGRTTVTGTGAPVVRINGTSAGYAGVATCGSVWTCASCAAKVAGQRADDLASVMRAVLDAGGSAALMTFTVRHHAGHGLRELWDAISKGWERVVQGGGWERDKQVAGMLGWVKAVEVTNGRNGWHPHVHVLVCWDEQISAETAQIVGDSMHARWASALAKHGFESWRESGGLDVRMASLNSDNLADYFVKLAREVTSQATKETRKGRPPFAILDDIAAHQLADDGDLWREWETASFRRRQLTWSRNDLDLRKFARLGEELTDEEAAAAEHQGDDVLALTPESWGWLVANESTTDLLDAAELGGSSGVITWLDRHGLTYDPAGRAAPPSTPPPPEAAARRRRLWRPTLHRIPHRRPDDGVLVVPVDRP